MEFQDYIENACYEQKSLEKQYPIPALLVYGFYIPRCDYYTTVRDRGGVTWRTGKYISYPFIFSVVFPVCPNPMSFFDGIGG